MAEILRQKSGAERLAIADGMYSAARQMILNMLRSDHPDWDEERIIREAARRLSHGETQSIEHLLDVRCFLQQSRGAGC